MARGGARPGAGRKPGSTRPQLRDTFTAKELNEFAEDLKTRAKTDSRIALFIAEQIYGKAVQPIGNDGDNLLRIKVEISETVAKKNGLAL